MQEVGADQHGAPLGRVATNELAHPVHALGVESVDRFVEDEMLRVTQQSHCQAEALLHTEGELLDLALLYPCQADLLQAFVGAGLRDPRRLSNGADVRPGGMARHVPGGFEKSASDVRSLGAVGMQRLAVESDLSPANRIEPQNAAHR